jgi:hypothetical protein
MPSLDDYLIYERLDYLFQQISENLNVIGQIDGNEVKEWVPNPEDFVENRRFATKWLQLGDSSRIMLCEEYDIEEYNKLKIVHYAYIWSDMNGNELLRAENAHPHNVFTDPHHIHDFRFGKNNVKPFRGQDLDKPNITEFFAHRYGDRL